jgi:hypothetical protein
VYKTTRDHARRARAILDQAHVQRVGLVVTGVRESPGGYEYYSRVGDEQLADAPRDRAGRAPAT